MTAEHKAHQIPFDLGSVEMTWRRKRKGRRSYSYLERTSSLNSWWSKNNMTTLIKSEAVAWVQKKSSHIAEDSGISVEFASHQMNEINSSAKLVNAIHKTNGKPITINALAVKLKGEKLNIESQLQGMGTWVGEFFEDLVNRLITDGDNGARPSLTVETAEEMKAIIRGEKIVI